MVNSILEYKVITILLKNSKLKHVRFRHHIVCYTQCQVQRDICSTHYEFDIKTIETNDKKGKIIVFLQVHIDLISKKEK